MKFMKSSPIHVNRFASSKRSSYLFALGLLFISSSIVAASELPEPENNQIVTAMYGFINSGYTKGNTYSDADYINDLVEAVSGTQPGPDYSDDRIYLEELVKAVNGE